MKGEDLILRVVLKKDNLDRNWQRAVHPSIDWQIFLGLDGTRQNQRSIYATNLSFCSVVPRGLYSPPSQLSVEGG